MDVHELYVECLDRQKLVADIRDVLFRFDAERHNVNFKKGLFLYGSSGSGKTALILRILRDMGYDAVTFNTSDTRNKALVDTITQHNLAEKSVMSMFHAAASGTTSVARKIAVVMDEIDGMNSGDKGGITSLIKLIRQKKTKKQKSEETSWNPVICIGNYYTDKKLRELMKVCHTFEVPRPTAAQTMRLAQALLGRVGGVDGDDASITFVRSAALSCRGDLRKLDHFLRMHLSCPGLLSSPVGRAALLESKSYVENVKMVTKQLFSRPHALEAHSEVMNDTDRTIVALLWHENLADAIQRGSEAEQEGNADPGVDAMSVVVAAATTKRVPALLFYQRVLSNICFADYMDRITFQNQIWQFNELTSILKTFYTQKMYHEWRRQSCLENQETVGEIRFTKVLTKYSTEYNNSMFVQGLCQLLDMDQRDVFSFFQTLRGRARQESKTEVEALVMVEKFLEPFDVNKLYVKRMYRYLDAVVQPRDTASSSLPVAVAECATAVGRCDAMDGGLSDDDQVDAEDMMDVLDVDEDIKKRPGPRTVPRCFRSVVQSGSNVASSTTISSGVGGGGRTQKKKSRNSTTPEGRSGDEMVKNESQEKSGSGGPFSKKARSKK